MKIGIFGDSYADEHHNKFFASYPSWMQILRSKYSLDVTSYGLSATSLFYSYKKLLEHKHEFDKIIFLTTVSGRIMVPSDIPMTNEKYKHINSVSTARFNISQIESNIAPSTAGDFDILKAAEAYSFYLYDAEKEELFHDMLVKKIKEDNPDVIFVDTISNWRTGTRGLSCIAKMEIVESGLDAGLFKGFTDNRVCHLSKRNNEILADKMYSWLNGEPVHINVNEFKVPLAEEISGLLKK